MIRRFRLLDLFRQTALVMIVATAILGMVPKVDAAFIPSTRAMDSGFYARNMDTVRQFLESKVVKHRLEALGYSAEEIESRVSRLSEKEIHLLAVHIDTLTTAGDGMGTVIGVLVIILLVIVILKLLNKQIIIR